MENLTLSAGPLCFKKYKHMSKSTPTSESQWIVEIAKAYLDAKEAIPFGTIVGNKISEKDLFHMAPLVCIKYRQIKDTKKNQKKATEAALSSYVANSDANGGLLKRPVFGFAFCYILAHYGLDLIETEECEKAIACVESRLNELEMKVKT